MACKTCGNSMIARAVGALRTVENKFLGKPAPNVATPPSVPTTSLGSDDGNVYGDPTSRISMNGTNARFLRR